LTELTQKYLERAEFFHLAVTQGWTDVCGGGLYWEHSNHYKNAIPNELFLMTSTTLHMLLPNSTANYLQWAQREWAWFEASGARLRSLFCLLLNERLRL
jgi:predicted alpha-1,6-mannanase (GH76 family)